jgi:5-methylcytosine-specific restriction endonuclease McrA
MQASDVVSLLLAPEEINLDQYSDEDLSKFLRYLEVRQTERTREILLRVAIHFTPQQALAKLQGNTISSNAYSEEKEPYQMIITYVSNNFDLSEKESKRLGYRLGRIWKNWQAERDKSTINIGKNELKQRLSKRQKNRCKNCGAQFERSDNSVLYTNNDGYKPVSEFTEQQYKKELDHVEPLSKFGSDEIDNLQLLCRFCNQGKKDDTGFSLDDRLEIASKDIIAVSASKRRTLFFEATASKTQCERCGKSVDSVEMTVRKQNENGCFASSNLEMVCVDCAYE